MAFGYPSISCPYLAPQWRRRRPLSLPSGRNRPHLDYFTPAPPSDTFAPPSEDPPVRVYEPLTEKTARPKAFAESAFRALGDPKLRPVR